MIGTFIKTFWQSTIVNGVSFIRSNNHEKAKAARYATQLFYFFVLLTSIQTFSQFTAFPSWDVILESKHLFDPIWSAKWIPLEHWEFVVRTILISFLCFSLLGVVLWERYMLVRAGVFLSFFLYISLISSFGKIDHHTHVLLLASFLLIFIPNKNSKSEASNVSFLQIILGIQTLILLTYFVSGFFKFYGILNQELAGLDSALALDSLAQNTGKVTYASNTHSFFGDATLKSTSIIQPIILILGYLTELLSVYIIFKPKFHRVWGFILIALHVGILLTVGPDFTPQIIVVGIFFLFSPFSAKEFDFLKDVRVFIRSIKNLFVRRPKSHFIVFYDGDCLMCNGFLKFIAKYDLPDELRISKLQSDAFEKLKEEKVDLNEIDSIVILESNPNGEQKVRIKAEGITWTLAKVSRRFVILKVLYFVFPFLGNALYDVIAKSRKKADPNNCPIPPETIRKRMLN